MADKQDNGELMTVGRKKLCAAIDSGAWNQTSVARELGISQPSVCGWCSGNTRPDYLYRRALSRVLGIPEDDWLTAEERKLVFGRSVKKKKAS